MKKNIFKIILLIAIDQMLKFIIINTVGVSGKAITVVPKLLSIIYVENSGAAFGMFLERFFLIALDIVIIVFLIRLSTSKKFNFSNNFKSGMSLIIAGGAGNLIDRIFRGHVIDYIDVSGMFNFPVFNFSDICIVVGVMMSFVIILIETVKSQEKSLDIKE